MSIPTTTRATGGPWDVVYQIGSDTTKRLGVRTESPALEQLVTQFSPSIRFGGDAGYAYSEAVYQKIVVPGFTSGGDKRLYGQDSQRYYWSDGKVALQREDRITLGSAWDVTDATQVATAREIIDFSTANGDYVCVGVGKKIRAYNANTGVWSTQQPATEFGSNVKSMLANYKYLFAALGSATDAQRWDGVATTAGWTTLTGIKANCWGWYREKLYRAISNTIVPAGADNSGTAWGTALTVGWDSTEITDLREAAGYLVIAKPEGIFLYDETNVFKILDTETVRTSTNGRGLTEWQGTLYIPRMNTVQKAVVNSTTSASYTDITPYGSGTVLRERYGHGQPIRLFGGPAGLYAAFHQGEGLYPEVLIYTGVGWHQLYRGTSGDTMYAAGYSRLMSWLLVNDGSTRRRRLSTQTEAEYPDYATSGQFETPDFDAGLSDIVKSWPYLALDLENVDTANTVKVEYSTDKGTTWTTVQTITTSGVARVILNGVNMHVSAQQIRFRFTLARNAADITATPMIRLPLVIAVLPVPPPQYAYADRVVLDLSRDLHNGWGKVEDAYEMQEILDFLDDLSRTADVISRYDEFGVRNWVRLTDKALVNVERNDASGLLDYTRRVVQLTFGEIYNGLRRFVTQSATIRLSDTTATGATGWMHGQRDYGLFTYGGTA